MIRLLCRIRSCARGVSLLELTIVLPILLLLVGGVVDIGRVLKDRQVLQDAVRDGARNSAKYVAHMGNPTDPIVGCVQSGSNPSPSGSIWIGRVAPSPSEIYDLYRFQASSLASCDVLLAANPINIGEAAKKTVCERLHSAGIPTANWIVTPEILSGLLEGENTRFMRLRIEGSSQCTFCYSNIGNVKLQNTYPIPVPRGLSCGGR